MIRRIGKNLPNIRVRFTSHQAGTASRRVEMEIVDKVVKAKNGSNLFLGREITATLTGPPALQREKGAHDEELHAVKMR